MLIRCWGSRGSIPVSGESYLKYGGDTTCVEIRSKSGESIIIDAGSGIRRLGNQLFAENRTDYHLIFTHAHWDHILGFPYFKPIYRKGTHINFYGCPFAQASIRDLISKSMAPPNFPVNFSDIKADIAYNGACSGSFTIGSLAINPVLLSHPNQGIGYKFVEDGKSFVFLTDNELGFRHPGGLDYRDYQEFCSSSDLLIHDAEFTADEYATKKGWGHSVYTDALNLALDAGVRQFGLFHHNQERSDREVDGFVESCRTIIQESGSALRCLAVGTGTEIQL